MTEYPLCLRGMSETEIFRELPAGTRLGSQKINNAAPLCARRRKTG
jgi:hypothetical protein